MAKRILLDTDIGTDIDDVYALILAAVSPELDLRGVITVNNDVCLRAKIARRVLDLIGRPDVPVACGTSDSLTPGETRGWLGHEGIGIDLEDAVLDGSPQWLGLVARELDLARQAKEPLTLVTIGAMTNAALMLRQLGRDAGRGLDRILAMASTFEGTGPASASPEHNVACDPVAAAQVIASGVPLWLVGLNVTMQTAMDRAFVDSLSAINTEAARAVTGMHREWFRVIGRDQSPMHDGLAIAGLIEPEILTWREVAASLEPDSPEGRNGAIRYDDPTAAKPANCRVAVSVDTCAYEALLHDRVRRALSDKQN
jgi:inosine-uridine nucleoside N-ribohydrolase